MSDLVGPPRPSQVVSAFVGHWLLIFPPFFWSAGPALAPLPHTDPISLRSQATALFHVGHNIYQQWWVPLLKKVTITSLLVFQPRKNFTIFTDQKKMAIFWCLCIAQKLSRLLKIKAKKSLIYTFQQKSNDYFAARYWALKKVKIISILFTGPRKKLMISYFFLAKLIANRYSLLTVTNGPVSQQN